ncbi:Acg family FMN-binding oxidoreductase [Actinokineospora enzanensis]|uniref:Acg family FMN-binding oxidoreductase n=1 Tax=Actinokineospora enzanensis TaxID=155975 RepID=UPI0003A44384|nr:nitroreductase family protein [Actinokineospora enzanensis]
MPTTSKSPVDDAVLWQALRAAVRAPSPHNTQPWRFVVRGGRVEVRLDRGRVLAVADPDAREARLSCGAALFNLRLRMAAAGHETDVRVMPDHADLDLLAVVEPRGAHRATDEERLLAGAIDRRHTNRRPFLERPVPLHLRGRLERAAVVGGALPFVAARPEEFTPISDLVRKADRIQDRDPDYHAELRSWLADAGRPDGVPTVALGHAPAPDNVITPRDFGAGAGSRQAVFERQPLLVVLTTAGDTLAEQVVAGQATQRVLLTAAAEGLAVSFLSQPIEVPAVRAALGEYVGGTPHTVLRIGFGYPGAPTPRRPADLVTSFVTTDRNGVE